MTSPKRLARIAGVLYLFVGITGGFAEGFVEPKVYVAGEAAATAAILIAAGLVRLGVVSDLVDQTLFVFLAMTLTCCCTTCAGARPGEWSSSSHSHPASRA